MEPLKPMQDMQPMQFDDPVGDILAKTLVPGTQQSWSDVIRQRQMNNERLSITAHVPGGDRAALERSLKAALGAQVGQIDLHLD